MNTSNWFKTNLPLIARLLAWGILIVLIVVSVPISSAQSDYLKLGIGEAGAVSLHLFTFSGEPYYSMVHDICTVEDEALLSEMLDELDRQYPAPVPQEQPLCWGELALSDGRIISLEVYGDTVVIEHGLAVMRCSVPSRVFREYLPEDEGSGEAREAGTN